MSNFLKWGQVTFSQRGKATTTTKKSGGGRGGEGTAAPVSLRRSRWSGERGGAARAGGAGPGGGSRRSGRSSLRGWDVRDASFAAQPGAGGAGMGWGGGDTGGRAAQPAAAPPLPVWPSAWLGSSGRRWGLVPRLPQDSPTPFKKSLSGVRVRGSILAAVSSARTRWGSRHLFL